MGISATVESIAACGGPGLVDLEVRLRAVTGAGSVNGKFEVTIVPGYDLGAFFGGNFGPFSYPLVRTLGDGDSEGSATDLTFVRSASALVGPVPTLPCGYDYLAATTRTRWVKIFQGDPTNHTNFDGYSTFGELLLASSWLLTSAPEYPVWVGFRYPGQTRYESRHGQPWIYNVADQPAAEVTLAFHFVGDTEYLEARDRIYRASEGGRWPILLVPTETDADLCIYGHIVDAQSFARDSFPRRQAELTLRGLPFPAVA